MIVVSLLLAVNIGAVWWQDIRSARMFPQEPAVRDMQKKMDDGMEMQGHEEAPQTVSDDKA